MALINCKECKKEISENVEVCPHCGNTNKQYQQEIEGKWTKALYIIVGTILLLFGLYHMFNGTNKTINKNIDNDIIYNNQDNTYTVTIWEDKNIINEL